MASTRRTITTIISALAAATLTAGLVSAVPPTAVADRGAPASHLDLPRGFQPEGITTGPGRRAYLGSLVDGDIYRLDLRTGDGKVIGHGPGTPSVGLTIDKRGRLFVAGGSGGDARVVDSRTGKVLASYTLVRKGESFINDVVLTKRAAWFTNSLDNELYRIPLGRHGKLPKPGAVERVRLTGHWEQVTGFNANGITTTPDRAALLVVNTAAATLYRVRRDGRALLVDLDGAELTDGDGLLRERRTLYAVQNQLNQVAVVRLARDGRSGELARPLTSRDFDIPTTIARSGCGLYLPNARFTTTPRPRTPYWVTRLQVCR